jgi:hypothetical protein
MDEMVGPIPVNMSAMDKPLAGWKENEMPGSKETWEYTSVFVHANIDNDGAREYIKSRWPEWKGPKKYSPETLIPELDRFGMDGWELVSMEPVVVGDHHDIAFMAGLNTTTQWSNIYFCAFKRKRS